MNEHCQCDGAGFCERHGVKKTRREHELCRGVKCTPAQCSKYWTAWEYGKMPHQDGAVEQPIDLGVVRTTMSGAGTELKKLLKDWLGVEMEEGCQCDDYAAKMDAWGEATCRERIDEIVGVMVEEAIRREWWIARKSRKVAERGAKLLVMIAVHRSERRKRAKKNGMPYLGEWADYLSILLSG